MKNSGTENGDSVVQIFWKKLFDSKSSFPCMGIFTNRGGSSRNPKFFEDLLKTTVFKNVLKTLWTTTPLFSGLVLVKIKRCCSNLHSVEKKETLRSRYVQLLAVESWLPFLLWISNYIGVWIPDVLETAQIQYHVFICCVWLLPMPFFYPDVPMDYGWVNRGFPMSARILHSQTHILRFAFLNLKCGLYNSE
jgi:hypothetical protein